MKKLLRYISITLLCSILILMALNIDKIKFAYELLISYKNLKNIEEKDDLTIELPSLDEIEVVQNPIEKLPIGNANKEESIENDSKEELKNSNMDMEEEQNLNSNQNDDKKSPVSKNSEINNSNSNYNTNIDKNESNDNNNNDTSKSDEQIYYDIVEKYYNKLTEMQREYEAKINSLIKKGYDEYISGNTSVLELASKYLSLGADLEKESDKKVENILDEMENELVTNNLDTSILSEIQEYYEYLKDLRKSELMSKAKEYMD